MKKFLFVCAIIIVCYIVYGPLLHIAGSTLIIHMPDLPTWLPG